MIEFLYTDPSFMKRCLYLTKNVHDAEDLLQDAALKLMKTESILQRPVAEIKAYAYTMIKNRFIDNKRNSKTRRINTGLLETVTEPTTDRDIQAKLDLTAVEARLHKLNIVHKKALLMVSAGMTYREVSDITKVPVNTLLADVREARAFLKGERAEPRVLRSNRAKVKFTWNEAEDEILRNFSYLGAQRIGQLLLDRSTYAIYIRARKIGVVFQQSEWSKDEDAILQTNFQTHTSTQLKKFLPSRTAKAIRNRCSILGLKKQVKKGWTEQEKQELRILYRTTKAKALETKFGRKIKAIERAYHRMAIPAQKFMKRKNSNRGK